MANKKPIKKAVAKPTSKKVVKPVAKKAIQKVVAKSAPKKVISKKTTPKPVAKKPVAKKQVPSAKPVSKKAIVAKKIAKPTAKPVVKSNSKTANKVVAKVNKPIAKKAVSKKIDTKNQNKTSKISKPVVKVPVVKKPAESKSVKKVIEKKSPAKVEKKSAEKVVEISLPKKEKSVQKPTVKNGKKTPTKTVITSINMMPKKSDVYKTNTFGANTLKNDSGKVIAHRKTSELKRKVNEIANIKKYEPEFTRSILDMGNTNEGPSYRYSDDDLGEFRELILKKLETAKAELQYLQGVIMRKDEGGTEDTENKYQNIEDGGASMEREQFNQLASRQITFIGHLEQALVRIENKTYGICRETGKLIDKARLRAVPHATLSIEAKNAKKN